MEQLDLCQPVKSKKHIKCEHGKQKYRCIQCGGASICIHNREKYICHECNGKGICHHNKQIRQCHDCKGINICEHNINKSTCKTCKGSSVCEHNRQRCRCKICSPDCLCKHNILKGGCKTCNPSILCVHSKRKSQCLLCKPKILCEHKKRKFSCPKCSDSRLCINCKLVRKSKKYDNHCLRCFIYLFPDQPVTRNYKTKETATAQFITNNFPNFTWNLDKRVEDGCSKRRPDLLCDLGYQVIIVEVDENQHTAYDCSCENKRIMQISQDVGHRPIIFIRFNPDDYINSNGEKITSCWSITPKTGILKIKNNKNDEWLKRLDMLKETIEYWSNPENKTEKTLEVIQLFYTLF